METFKSHSIIPKGLRIKNFAAIDKNDNIQASITSTLRKASFDCMTKIVKHYYNKEKLLKKKNTIIK